MRHPDFDIETIICYAGNGNMSSTWRELVESEYEDMTADDLTEDEVKELDERIQECDFCGWPYEVDELSHIPDEGMLCWRCEENYYDEERQD